MTAIGGEVSRACLATFVLGAAMVISGFALVGFVSPSGDPQHDGGILVAFFLLVLGGGLVLDVADGMIG